MKIFTICALLIVAVFLFACDRETISDNVPEADANPSPDMPADDSVVPETLVSEENNVHTIEITSSGFNPSSIRINTGDEVTFVNKDKEEHWPASAVHPTHLAYPEAGGCIGSKFDSCEGLSEGESLSFTFNHKGDWKYHDHLNPKFRGSIKVE